MRIKELVQNKIENSLEEIDRRGFLKGLGAAAIAGGLGRSASASAHTENKIVATLNIAGETKVLDLSPKNFKDVKEATKWLEKFLDDRGIDNWSGKIERGIQGSGNYERMRIDSTGANLGAFGRNEGISEGIATKTAKPRNFVAKNAMKTTSGAGAHKDKKRAEKQGDVKHKNKFNYRQDDWSADFERRMKQDVAEGEGKTHVSPSGVKTNMDPTDDDYAINYGKNSLVAKDVKTGSKKVKESLKDKDLATLQKVKKEIEKEKALDMDTWEKDFRQNYAPKFAHLKRPEKEIPDISSIGLEKPDPENIPTKNDPNEPQIQGTSDQLFSKARFLQNIIKKIDKLDNLKSKAEKLGILSSTLKSELDLDLYLKYAEKDEYQTLDQKIDSSIEKITDRINLHKIAYSTPRRR